MIVNAALESGRKAYEARAWRDAYAELTAAEATRQLDAEDLERVGLAAYLIGKDADALVFWGRAHHAHLDNGDVERAVRVAFWPALQLLLTGELARSNGWVARVERLLGDRDCVEQGHLAGLRGVTAMFGGDLAAALRDMERGIEIGERFKNRDVLAMCRIGTGQCLRMAGDVEPAMRLFDETMISIIGNEVSPILTGTLFCAVLLECRALLDVRRAHEWAEALHDWCEKQQELFPYRGECLIHRSELMQLHGRWQDASDEAARAIDQLAEPPRSPLGAAYYQKAEIHRVRGEFAEAEEAYASAARVGFDPHPGLALLRFAQGRLDAAESAIRRVRDARGPWTSRPSILSAFVEIVLAAGDVDAALDASDELTSLAESMSVPYPRALADGTAASVALAVGDARAALDAARRALAVWIEMGAPYEAARARLLIGRACATLGDDESAKVELATARETFEELGAVPDLARAETLSGSRSTGLTPREHVIIRSVAAGKTNKAIAHDLVISEKTVERHLSNIFTKLGVKSRAAATAYAYENHLV